MPPVAAALGAIGGAIGGIGAAAIGAGASALGGIAAAGTSALGGIAAAGTSALGGIVSAGTSVLGGIAKYSSSFPVLSNLLGLTKEKVQPIAQPQSPLGYVGSSAVPINTLPQFLEPPQQQILTTPPMTSKEPENKFITYLPFVFFAVFAYFLLKK